MMMSETTELIEVETDTYIKLMEVCDIECRSPGDQVKYMMRQLKYVPKRSKGKKLSPQQAAWTPMRRKQQAQRMLELQAKGKCLHGGSKPKQLSILNVQDG